MNNKNEEFKPFISPSSIVPEFTITSVILGIILAIVFGGANAYLGLRVGMTVSASIPAAVISMGIIRLILKKDSILENNIVQTIGSAGESVAAGAIFTLPVLFMWADEWNTSPPSYFTITIISICGSVLGILFMVPLRQALIVKEHGILPYPEGTACSEVLLAGENGGSRASLVFWGMGISAVYKFITDGLVLFPSQLHRELKSYKGSAVGIDILPALVSVGYICGPKIASFMLTGGVIGWYVLMPLISMFAGSAVLFPGSSPINEMTSTAVWSQYIRYIGAGAVATAGILSLIKSLPLILNAFKHAIKGYGTNSSENIRTNKDLSYKLIFLLILIIGLIIWLVPVIPVNFMGALIIILFGFFFATVSARMVGLVGSSNNPVSGMSIATLLIATFILRSTNSIGQKGMLAAITIGSIICIIAAIAGDTSQDLKTGFILGATPKNQQIGELIGVICSALAIGGVLYLLNAAWGYGSTELPAPQATLMKLVVEGVMNGNLPWTLVLVGAFLAIAIEIIGIPVLPFAVGLYLPIHLSLGIMAGGLVRLVIDKSTFLSDSKRPKIIENGILYTSGMIAGEGLIGILLAVFAIININGKSISEIINISENISIGSVGGIIFFILLLLSIIKFSFTKEKIA